MNETYDYLFFDYFELTINNTYALIKGGWSRSRTVTYKGKSWQHWLHANVHCDSVTRNLKLFIWWKQFRYLINIFIYIYIWCILNDVSLHLSPHWLCGNSWIGEKFASLFQDNELPQSHFGDKQKCKFFPWLHIYILDSTCFLEIWALCVSWITYDHFAFTSISFLYHLNWVS